MDNRSENMIQVGIAAIRAPDGRVIKEAPLYRPITPEEATHIHDAEIDFARIAFERMKAARQRAHIKI